MRVTLIGKLPNGTVTQMSFDPVRCEDGMAIVEWLCARSDLNSDLGWQRMNDWRIEQKLPLLF